jgi:hypothetical protein
MACREMKTNYAVLLFVGINFVSSAPLRVVFVRGLRVIVNVCELAEADALFEAGARVGAEVVESALKPGFKEGSKVIGVAKKIEKGR